MSVETIGLRILSEDEILDIGQNMDEVRLIGVPKFCAKYNITQEQLNEISEKTGTPIPKYRSLRKEQILALEEMIKDLKTKTAEELKTISYIELSKKYKVNNSTIYRVIRRELPELAEARGEFSNENRAKKAEENRKTPKPTDEKPKKNKMSGRNKSDAGSKAAEYKIKHPEISVEKIAKKFKTSTSTITRRLKDLREEKKVADVQSTEEVAIVSSEIKENPNIHEVKRGNSTMLEVSMDNYLVVAALVAERHQWPTEVCIFDHSLSSNEMFNYRWLDETVNKFIDEWIPFVNGKPTRKLGVYVAGLQCTLSALCRVCAKRQVNLDLYHYNNETCQYVTQTVYDWFEMSKMKNEIIYSYLTKNKTFGGLYTINCNFEKISHITTELYLVRKFYYPTPKSLNPNRIEYVIVHGLESCWSIFGRFIEELRDMNKSGRVSVT